MRIQRATTLAHEMAHQWFGNIVDAGVVGRPVAQRVLRRVHGQPGHRRRHGVRRRLGRQRLRAPPVGPQRRPAAEHPPGRRQRRGRRDAPRCRTSTASPTPRARASSSSSTRRSGDEVFFAGVDRPLHAAPLRQRDDARPVRVAGSAPARATSSAFTTNWLRTAGPDRIVLDRARRRDPAYAAGRAPGRPRRTRSGSPSRTDGGVEHRVARRSTARDAVRRRRPRPSCSTRTRTPGRSLRARPGDRRPRCKTLLPAVEDPALRAGIWNNVRSAFHNAAARPRPTSSTWSSRARPWSPPRTATRRLGWPWLLARRAAARRPPGRCERRARGRARASWRRPTPGSELQLVGLPDGDLHGDRRRPSCAAGWPRTPDGIDLDLDLRWRLLVAARRPRRDRRRRAATRRSTPSRPASPASSTCARRGVAARPPRRRRWAWDVFTGRLDVPNYELEAAGLGMWRGGQEDADRRRTSTATSTTCPAPSSVRSGWVLADATEFFFPVTSLTETTLDARPSCWPPTTTLDLVRAPAPRSTPPTTWPASSPSARPTRAS